MTPELEKELIVGVVSALFTALFAGIPGIALFWWTFRRDQERLLVDKLTSHWGILIRNRSLFPVYVTSARIMIDKQNFELTRYIVRSSSTDSDLREIPSQTFVQVIASDRVRADILAALHTKVGDDVSARDYFMSRDVVAVVISDTGKRFTSTRILERVKGLLKKALLAPG